MRYKSFFLPRLPIVSPRTKNVRGNFLQRQAHFLAAMRLRAKRNFSAFAIFFSQARILPGKKRIVPATFPGHRAVPTCPLLAAFTSRLQEKAERAGSRCTSDLSLPFSLFSITPTQSQLNRIRAEQIKIFSSIPKRKCIGIL